MKLLGSSILAFAKRRLDALAKTIGRENSFVIPSMNLLYGVSVDSLANLMAKSSKALFFKLKGSLLSDLKLWLQEFPSLLSRFAAFDIQIHFGIPDSICIKRFAYHLLYGLYCQNQYVAPQPNNLGLNQPYPTWMTAMQFRTDRRCSSSENWHLVQARRKNLNNFPVPPDHVVQP